MLYHQQAMWQIILISKTRVTENVLQKSFVTRESDESYQYAAVQFPTNIHVTLTDALHDLQKSRMNL